MAIKIIEKIRVTYRTSNGEKATCFFLDIPEKDKDSIVSLAVLPVYNKDGSESRQSRDLSDVIQDFPILTTLYYPDQLGTINLDAMRTNGCPLLNRVISTHNAGSTLDRTPLTIKTKGEISATAPTEESITAFGNLVENKKVGTSIVDVYTLTSGSATVARAPEKPRPMTYEDVVKAIEKISKKLEVIESRADHPEKVLTADQIERILNNYVGKITIDELENIMSAIQGISVNVDSAHLSETVENALRERLDTLVNNQDSQSKKLDDIIESIEKIRRGGGNETEIYALLSRELPVLIGKDSKATNNINIQTGISGVDAENSITLKQIATSLQELGDKFNSAMNAKGLSQETKEDINALLTKFAQNFVGGNSEFLSDIQKQLASNPTAQDVRNIVREELEISSANPLIKDAISGIVTDAVLKSIKGLGDKDKSDLEYIKTAVSKVLSYEDVKDALVKVVADSALATSSDIKDINAKIEKLHDDVNALINKKAEESSQIITAKDILEIINNSDENSIDQKFLRTLVDYINAQGMNKEQVKEFLNSPFGATVIAQATSISKVSEDLKKSENAGIVNNVTVNTAENAEQVKSMQDAYMQMADNAVKAYASSLGLAYGAVTAISAKTGTMATGFQPGIDNPFAFANPAVNNYNPIVAQIALLNNYIGQYLQKTGQTPTDTDSSKAIIEKLTKENEELKKQNEELKTKVDSLTKTVEELNNNVAKLTKQLEEQNKSVDDDKKKKEDDGQRKKEEEDRKREDDDKKKKKKEEEIKRITPDKAELPLPDLQSKAFVKDSIKFAEKLKEPKLSRGKRFLNWVKRHPLALTAIGLGAGALVATGVGAVSGLVGIKLLSGNTLLQYMSLKLPKIALGAVAGLGVGAVAEVGTAIARKFGVGRKERLYRKFQKGYEQCNNMREDIEKNVAEIEATKERLEKNREKQRTKKGILKKLGVYKMARNFERKKLRKLNTKARGQEKSYKSHVEETLKYKKDLNELEENSGKTLAMGGYLQKLNNAKAKRDKELSEAEDDDEAKDINDDFEEILKDLKSDSGVEDLDKIKPSHRTFDAEAEELINSIKGEKSASMKEIEKNIKDRTATRGEPKVEVVVEPKDPNEWKSFVEGLQKKADAGEKVTDKEKTYYLNVKREAENQEKLKENGYMEAGDYVAKNPGVAVRKLIEEAQNKKRAEFAEIEKKLTARKQAEASKLKEVTENKPENATSEPTQPISMEDKMKQVAEQIAKKLASEQNQAQPDDMSKDK